MGDEVDEVIDKLENEESIQIALPNEIRYRKFIMLSIKPSNAIILQNKLFYKMSAFDDGFEVKIIQC